MPSPAGADRRTDLTVVLPAYNSARFIGPAVHRLVEYGAARGINMEVLVCDDGSTDGTAMAVPALPRVAVLRASRNQGKGAAVRRGMLAARGDIRAFTDADLPYGVEPLDLARTYIGERGFHAVIGDRTLPGSEYEANQPVRSAVSALASFAFRTLVTGGIYDTQCGIKAFRGDVAEALFGLTRVDGFAFDVEVIYLLLKYRLDIKRIPVRLERNEESTVRVGRDSAIAARDILRMRVNWASGRYTSAPLQDILRDDLDMDLRSSPLD